MAKTVLIVEDEPTNMKLCRDLLRVSGFKTLEATDGKQAIELARKYRPALILMDVQMPVMDGLAATEVLKADPSTGDIPVLALTSYAMKGDEERVLKAGCDAYMTKPIDTQEFLRVVRTMLCGGTPENGTNAESNGG